ncbi:MAG: MAPEG family protein [Gammaproteobacteria bacterium]|nr:MAPEG family protein [Gammaproteobacteria bacterium]MDH5617729.1 MAPEG family protein [Gammaproteobacteria bacterium]
MTPELTSLAWVVALSAVMWVPYVLNVIMVRGLVDAVGYPENPKPMAAWAGRMKAAHYNAVENLVVFATLVLIAHVAGISNPTTVLVCQVYFWARLVHVVAYTLGIPWVRTLAFVTGWIACVALLFELL